MNVWKIFITVLFLTSSIFGDTKYSLDLSEKRLNNWKISTDGKIWENTKVPSNILENDKYKDSETFFLKTKFDFIFNSDKQYSLRLGIISDKDIVYINNHIIGNSENFSSYLPGNYDKVRIYEIPSYLLQEKNNEIKIKIKRYFDYEAGILNEVPTIGESSSIHSKILHQEYLKILFLSIYAVISIFFLFLYIRGARDISYIYFFLASFSVILYQFLRTQLKYDLNFNFIFFKKVEYITLAIAIFLYANFIHSIFRKNKFKNPFKFFVNSLEKGKFKNFLLFFKYDSIQLLNIIYVLGFILYFKKQEIKEFDIINKSFFQPFFIIYIINIIYTLILYSKKKNKDAYFLLFSTIILGSSVILDIISDRGFIQLPRTVGFVFILFHSTVGLILVNRFVRMKEELKEVNSKLEEKVLLRTNELSVSLNEVNELKLKQDADYFLINLLVDPLSINLNNSKNVSSEIHVNQKKKFDFRKRNYQIGGDLCLCQNIKINGKNFTFFVNADAMGKSIQGAGGALVLGVLLRTILTRSKNIIINFSIEKWMENLFNELQNTFESFDGSMLISAFIGLIDDYSGKLTYINAENPGTVLYRDNNAFFLDTSSLSRKFGTPDNIFSPGSIQLKCSDILICGSDGRDDILLEKGNKLSMNQDENLFLKKVEESKGQLFSLVYNIMKTGELTDDFSLIKIQYKSPFYNINEDLYPKQSLNFEEKELTYSL